MERVIRMFTDKEISNILDDITIIIDTREKKNDHITDIFDEMKVHYRPEKMDSGDYTFELPNYPELGLDGSIVVERKNSLDEISQNFTKHRDRFQREFQRFEDESVHILIENATWKKLLKGSYRSKLPPKSFVASLITWSIRYDSNVWMVTKAESAVVIYNLIYYGLRERLKDYDS